VLVFNNLILGADTVGFLGGDPAEPASARAVKTARLWSFQNNWWELGPKTDVEVARQVATMTKEVPLLSRDPPLPDLLRPPAGSPLGNAGAGGDMPAHVGALRPAGTREPRRAADSRTQ